MTIIIWSITSQHRNSFCSFVSLIAQIIWCTSILTCLMIVFSNLTIFLIIISIIIFFLHMWHIFCLRYGFSLLLPVLSFSNFLQLIIFVACCFKSSTSLQLCRNRVYLLYHQMNIVWILNNNTVCLFTFVINNFSELFLHVPIFSNKGSVSG